jgi:hypothetical protein
VIPDPSVPRTPRTRSDASPAVAGLVTVTVRSVPVLVTRSTP